MDQQTSGGPPKPSPMTPRSAWNASLTSLLLILGVAAFLYF